MIKQVLTDHVPNFDRVARKMFSNESFLGYDRFSQIFVRIGTILVIFRPFDISVLFEYLGLK